VTTDPYTHKKLLEYVMSMLAQGWDMEVIRRELRWAGHSSNVIEAVLNEVLASYGKDVHAPAEAIRKAEIPESHDERPKAPEEEKPSMTTWASIFLMKSTSVEKTFSAIYFVLIFILIFWTGLSSESPVANVFAGFLPVLLTVLTVFALFDYFEDREWLVFAIPIAWCVLFMVAVAYSALPMMKVLDSQNLFTLNFVLGIVFSGIVYFLGRLERSLVEKERMRVVKKKVISEITGEEKKERHGEAMTQLDAILKELEDSAKHLDASINRVYSAHHGGSPAMREGLKIPAEWFHEYKQTSHEHSDPKLRAAKKAVALSYERLMDFKKQEKEIFGPAALELQYLNRDKHGRSKIIDVLVSNDREPVHDHYQRALDACSKAIDSLKHAGLLPAEK